MWRYTRTRLWASKRRLFGTSIAIILGVAFLAGTLVAGDSMRARFDQAFTQANAGIDVLVRDETTVGNEMSTQRRPMPPDIVDLVAGVDGVAAAVPTIQGIAQIVGADGDVIGDDGPPTFASNWITDESVNPWNLDDGRAPATAGEVVIDRRSADRGDLSVGSVTTVQVPEPVEVEVVGIARYGEDPSMGPTTFTAFTLEDARTHLLGGMAGSTDVVVVGDGVVGDELAARIAAVLPSGVEAITNAELTSEMNADIEADFLGLMQTFLMIFAGIALVVATFSIYNTFSIVVAQRTKESALLRAVGASRRQIVGWVIVEGLVLGLVASVIGFGIGVGLAAGLFALFEAMEFTMPGDGMTISPGSIVAALAVGTGVTVLASVGPAVRASRVPPIAALRDVAIDTTHTSKVRAAMGSVGAAAGAVLAVNGANDGAFGVVALGVVVLLASIVALGPLAARLAAGILGAPIRRLRGLVGNLAAQNAGRNPRRTANTASALMVGLAIVIGFTVFAATLRTFIADSVDQSFRADAVVSMSTFGGSGLSPALVDELDARPEVSEAVGLGLGAVMIDGASREVTISDPVALETLFDAGTTSGSIGDLATDEIAVSAQQVRERGWEPGTVVDVEFVDGTRTEMSIGAVFERRELLGEIVMSESAYLPHAIQHTNMHVLVGFADGVGADAGIAAVEEAAVAFGSPPVETREQFIDSNTAQVDTILAVIYVMLALAIFIALAGIANTLALSLHERTRELGLLRAVGETRSQVRAMVRWESVVIALFGTFGGLGLGAFAGWVLVRAMGEYEGMTLRFTLPVTQLAVVVAAAVAAGVVAALRPAWRASKLDVLEAIATE